MKNLIESETEDIIYDKYQFVKNLKKTIDKEVEEVTELIYKDVCKNSDHSVEKEKVFEWVFDYMWNCEELLSFEEYLDSFNANL